MKAFIRLFALLFAIIIVFCSVTSCTDSSNEKPDESTRKKRTKSTTTTVKVETLISPSSLPEIDWKEDTFYILGADSDNSKHLSNFEIWREKKPDDIVGEAVFLRNEKIKNKYNFLVEQDLVADTANTMQPIYDAQDDIYDLIIYRPDKAMVHSTNGYLLNLYDIPYVNFEHSAWNSEVNKDFTINDCLYFSTNKFLLQDKAMTMALAYNEELAKDILKNSNITLVNIPELVQNGKWTLEVFNEFTKNTVKSASENQSNKLGLECYSTDFFAAFFYGSGAALSRNVNGSIELIEPTHSVVNKIDVIAKTLFDDTLTEYSQNTPTASGNYLEYNNTLFYANYVHIMGSDNFELAYVLPFPKYDEMQASYYNLVSPNQSSVFAIPYIVTDPASIGFYLEAISEEAVDTTYPAFIKSIKWHSHGAEEKLLDLVLSSQKFDISATLNFGGVYTIISQTLPEVKTNVYERQYKSKGDSPIVDRDNFLNSFSK